MRGCRDKRRQRREVEPLALLNQVPPFPFPSHTDTEALQPPVVRVGLLLLIGLVLVGAAFLPQNMPVLIPEVVSVQMLVGLVLGLAVGVVSSLLGVAGGALLIPMLIFAYGLDIKAAGTASLIVSLPIVVIGIARFARFGAYHQQSLRSTVAPMGASSVLGAMSGGLLVGFVPVPLLTGGLGALIIYSAWRTFAVTHRLERLQSCR